jgi:putative DNA methylase
MNYPKRLIEVDLPIKRISAHARREKSIRHGHISTLHIWWARRPLAACRAVICASLWIDPVDELCPQSFRDGAVELIMSFAKKAITDQNLSDHCSPENWTKWQLLAKPENELNPTNISHLNILRNSLLDFIADFANWDNSTQLDYLETSRQLTQLAHESLGGIPGTRPLVVDPFAGGGAIPLEALRVGADAFASDLNPVAVLLNKVVLEYIPKYGQQLADEVRKWGKWVKDEAEKELAEFYPKDEDGSTPIAYLWARTIISEAPDDGTGIPVEVPLMRSLWLAKKKGRSRAMRWVRDSNGKVETETIEVTYADGVTRQVRRPLLEIFEPKNEKEVENGTVARGSATCPVTGYTTPVASVRSQLKPRLGGTEDARLFCVITTKPTEQGRVYRLSTQRDLDAVKAAVLQLENNQKEHNGDLSLVPDEIYPPETAVGALSSSVMYGFKNWGNIFTSRQSLSLTTMIKLVKKIDEELECNYDKNFKTALKTCLALIVDRQADYNSSLCTWNTRGEYIGHTFGRQALPMIWDFIELQPFGNGSGNLDGAINWVLNVCETNTIIKNIAQVERCDAASQSLPDDCVQFICSDPPYYDATAYGDLSDFFYIWLRRSIRSIFESLLGNSLVDKTNEIVHLSKRFRGVYDHKTKEYFESKMQVAMTESCRILSPDGIGIIVFAHKSTAGWEAMLRAMIDAGWTITGSWAIDTEMGARMNAMNSAALASSVHLVCRPRPNNPNNIGDWRDVLQELPQRIHQWMPRLAAEGVVGADAIFACLGPALEIFSRYSSVEKASGEIVTLREYLEYVWAAVSKEALGMIFRDADATGLEEDARLTAMWLWTLSTAGDKQSVVETEEEVEDSDDDDEEKSSSKKKTGFTLDFDTARKIAQGLGITLEKLPTLVEIKKAQARLLPVAERANYLMGKATIPVTPKKKGQQQLSLTGILPIVEEESQTEGTIKQDTIGKTTLDRIHQAMILFNAGRSEALKRFLVDDGVGNAQGFWKLAQSLSALYPANSEEKRWVDGILARKKGLGF